MPNRMTLKQILRSYWVVLIAPVALFLPLLVRGEVLYWGTSSLQFIPWWVTAWADLKQGTLPLWNPLNGMGAPLLANYQLAFFYPPNWLLLLFAALGGAEKGASMVAWGFSLLAIGHLAWAGLGMAFLLRRLRFPWLAQVIGGLAYGLSGYLVGRIGFFSMVWAAAWLPWVIYFTDQIASPDDQEGVVDPPGFKLVPGLTICFALQLLTGHAQLTWYSILFATLWVTVGSWRSSPKHHWARRLWMAWCSFGTAILLAAGLAMIQLAPTFEYLRASHRAEAVAYDAAMAYSFWPWRLVTLFSPDFFGNPARGDYWGYAAYWEDHLYEGLLPVLLVVSTLWLLIRAAFRKKPLARRRLLAFLWVMILVAFLLAFGQYLPIFPFLYKNVPTFAMFQAPTRYLIWAAFAFPLLAAIGIEHWRCPTGRGLYWFHLGTAGAFAITLGAGISAIVFDNIRLTFIRATALTGVWALGFGLLTLTIPYAEKHGRRALWQGAVIAWTLCDLLFTGWTLNSGTSPNFYRGSSQAKSALKLSRPDARVFLSDLEEYDLKFLRFFRFKDFSPVGDPRAIRDALIPDTNLLDGISLSSNFDPLIPANYKLWMDRVQNLPPESKVSWLAWMGIGVIEHIDVSQPSGVRFDSVPNAQRLHWYRCAHFLEDSRQVWGEIDREMQSPVDEQRAVLIFGSPDQAPEDCSGGDVASVQIVSERPDGVAIEVDAPDGGWLELMDTYYPGWVASIDGKAVRLYSADGNFRAVHVEQGKHKVLFLYRPAGFYFGLLLSILVLLFIFILSVRRKRIRAKTVRYNQVGTELQEIS